MKPVHFLLLLLPFACSQHYESMLLGALQASYLVSKDTIGDCQLPSPTEPELQWAPYQIFFEGFLSDMLYYSTLCSFSQATSELTSFLQSDQLEMVYGNLVMMMDVESTLTDIYSQLKEDGLTYDAGMKLGAIIKILLMLNNPYTFQFDGPVTTDAPITQDETGTPLAIFHGIGDCCCFPGMSNFTAYMKEQLGVYTRCVEIGDGPMTSWFTSMSDQVQMACQSIKNDKNFKNGLNVLGLSQGGLIARAIVEECGVPVSKLATMGGPHMGVASFPQCETGFFCGVLRDMVDTGVYLSFFQEHVAPAGYFNDPFKYEEFVEDCQFLPGLNNNGAAQNSILKSSLENLDLLLLIKFTKDTVVDPQESEWFGYYANNSMSVVIPWNETEAYQQNWLGLQTLDKAGKIDLVEIPAQHLQMTLQQIDEYIVSALKD